MMAKHFGWRAALLGLLVRGAQAKDQTIGSFKLEKASSFLRGSLDRELAGPPTGKRTLIEVIENNPVLQSLKIISGQGPFVFMSPW